MTTTPEPQGFTIPDESAADIRTEGDAAPERPSTVETLKAELIAEHKRISNLLNARRAERDALNETIRDLVDQETEAARLVNALKPRKPRQPKS